MRHVVVFAPPDKAIMEGLVGLLRELPCKISIVKGEAQLLSEVSHRNVDVVWSAPRK